MIPIRSEKSFTPRDWAGIHAGKPRLRILPGSRVLDLAALGKAISLCGKCEGKFDDKRHGYLTPSNLPRVKGECDGCLDVFGSMRLFLHNEKLPK